MQELALASLVHCLAWETDRERGMKWKLPGWGPSQILSGAQRRDVCLYSLNVSECFPWRGTLLRVWECSGVYGRPLPSGAETGKTRT